MVQARGLDVHHLHKKVPCRSLTTSASKLSTQFDLLEENKWLLIVQDYAKAEGFRARAHGGIITKDTSGDVEYPIDAK